jgi:mRNA-degrading endonuclease RelE of RelBE toxin-antitoxin system
VAAIYSIEIRPRARRSLRQLDTPARKAIATAIDNLAVEPRPVDVTAIKGHRPWLRTRVGDYRIITPKQTRRVVPSLATRWPHARGRKPRTAVP